MAEAVINNYIYLSVSMVSKAPHHG